MKRLGLTAILLAAIGAVGFLQAATGNGPRAAARPTPTPTPVAIQYDEIVRMYVPPASPAPPGTFHTDYRAIMAAAPPSESVAAAAPSPSPTPAPHKRGLFGAIGSVLNGTIPVGNPGGDQGQGGPGGPGASGGNGMYAQAMGRMNAMRNGTLTRYTYYWLKNWVRIDDPVARTATIEKCNLHQIITLDLAHKTYTITDTQSQMPCGQPGAAGQQGPTVENLAPGTSDLTFSSTGKNLGPLTLEGIGTTGTASTVAYAMTNSTGSCHDSNFKMAKVAYISRIGKQRAYCPLPAGVGAPDATSMAVHGGCKPRMHSSMNGMTREDDRFLEMYLLTTFGMGNGQSMNNLLERGNVQWFYKPKADELFSIPPGFTKAAS
ncbi:MAG TPA: hypothetical protein VMS32_11385 [Verrucomicrobiae bacterium]|jgi:hypothetical protein|nr:hypothetical protein [Verrucomicrobiae bacterium]